MKAIKGIGKITKTMEMVSVAKMRRTTARALQGRPYESAVHELVSHLPIAATENHPLIGPRPVGKQVIVFVAADKGLCGGYNSQLLRQLVLMIRESPNAEVITVGKTADKLVRRSGAIIKASFGILPEALDAGEVAAIAHYIVKQYLADTDMSSVVVLSQKLASSTSSQPQATQILPISVHHTPNMETQTEYRIEPEPSVLLDTLLPGYIESELLQIIIEARAAEHTTRMIAMKNASDNANEFYKELNISYNRVRQAGITQEIAEIVGGASALE